MPRSVLARVALAVVLGAAAVYAVQQLFPSEERRIRRQLDAIADDASNVTPGLSGVATAARLATYFTEDVVIDAGGGLQPLRGRDTILALARSVHTRGAARVSVTNADITVAPERTTAAVTLTVTVTRDVNSGKESLDARELALTMVKRDAGWLISHVTAVDTLR
jgi:hypothetical protein